MNPPAQAAYILLVEDNPHDEALAIRALQQVGATDGIAVVRDGVEALDSLLGPGADRGLPVVVLLDLKLPRVDGLEVLARLRADERTRLLPVVVLTSSDEPRDRTASYRLGANSYVRKPVEFDRFTETVQRVGLYWLGLNEPAHRKG